MINVFNANLNSLMNLTFLNRFFLSVKTIWTYLSCFGYEWSGQCWKVSTTFCRISLQLSGTFSRSSKHMLTRQPFKNSQLLPVSFSDFFFSSFFFRLQDHERFFCHQVLSILFKSSNKYYCPHNVAPVVKLTEDPVFVGRKLTKYL